MITTTSESLRLLQDITERINGQTFHHHCHILYDLPLPSENPNYLEIGCYAGASAILMLQKPNIRAISIDLGSPIHPSIVKKNIFANNPHNNLYRYILGDSHRKEIFDKLCNQTFDLLFIDGDHTGPGVRKDWEMYEPLVITNGFIVFDDYHDRVHSPEVGPEVDKIAADLDPERYQIIGTLPNVYKARGFPEDFTDGNCFIIKKL